MTAVPPRAPAKLQPVRRGGGGYRLRWVQDEWIRDRAGDIENWEPVDYASTDPTEYPTEEAALTALAAYEASGNIPKWADL